MHVPCATMYARCLRSAPDRLDPALAAVVYTLKHRALTLASHPMRVGLPMHADLPMRVGLPISRV